MGEVDVGVAGEGFRNAGTGFAVVTDDSSDESWWLVGRASFHRRRFVKRIAVAHRMRQFHRICLMAGFHSGAPLLERGRDASTLSRGEDHLKGRPQGATDHNLTTEQGRDVVIGGAWPRRMDRICREHCDPWAAAHAIAGPFIEPMEELE